ncbi:hypothetical protein CC85DRAFT_51955 [Cutaneotrichosporon oleaginosum]|uniref:Uncharacterized protein n=1 Tax=Cutaneotrichosporon oleaginosum TaxID=879819 RepID=A0A0J0XQN6_9TREE|nr:uncharacterized protein CC85DRAFT_51955 [Cutaneotrichosporon oleaginosum]KLT43390.1 hypothetical protein CC85DRAFT_51955 [Cutaneotrichosporon oleaginosum]TXT05396.1 hypothetical protein COLE_06716 [Cutaneotrichosporon oleaginosum]
MNRLRNTFAPPRTYIRLTDIESGLWSKPQQCRRELARSAAATSNGRKSGTADPVPRLAGATYLPLREHARDAPRYNCTRDLFVVPAAKHWSARSASEDRSHAMAPLKLSPRRSHPPYAYAPPLSHVVALSSLG